MMMMIFVTLLLTLIAIRITILLHRYFTRTRNYWNDRGVDGPIPLPFVGNFLDNFLNSPNVVEEKRLLKYGSVYGYFEFSQPILTIGDPNLIREVAIKQFHNFTNRYNRNPKDEFQKKGIFFMMDDDWKSVRSLISPVFTSSKVKKMFRHVQQCCDNTLQYVEGTALIGKEVVLRDVVVSYTMDSIAKCIFGIDTNGYLDPQNEFLKKAKELSNLKLWRTFVSLLTPLSLQYPLNLQVIDRRLINYFKILTEKIIEQRKSEMSNRDDFIDLLLRCEQSDSNDDFKDMISGQFANRLNENDELTKHSFKTATTKKTLDNYEILGNCILFLIAGFHSTSTLLNFTFYSLALNPEIQEKLFEEIKTYCSKHATVDYDAINELKYLDAVINEVMRLYSPVVALDRLATRDCVLGDLKIEKGTVLSIPFYAMHRNPDYFPNPLEFKPERFFPENRQSIKPYTFIPFGVGPRNCIGMRFALMNAKLFLVKLLQRFEVMQTENTPKQLKYTNSFITLNSEPLFAKFTKRK